MKRFITCILIFFCIAISGSTSFTAFASTSTPHIVATADVWLYDENGEKLFQMPSSYYARINNLDDNYYYVTFNGVATKVNKNNVSAIGYHATATGTMQEICFNSSYSDFTAINLKLRPDIGADNGVSIPIGESFTFIGSYPTDTDLWYYVKYGENYGYLRAERTSMQTPNIDVFSPEPEPSTETFKEETPNSEKDVIDKLGDKELKIIIIVGLAIPAVAIVILLFRPTRKRKENDYND